MHLMELFYKNADKSSVTDIDTGRYDPTKDTIDVLDASDTRKTKMTLRDINEMRKASDQHTKEVEEELEFISRMYATPPAQ